MNRKYGACTSIGTHSLSISNIVAYTVQVPVQMMKYARNYVPVVAGQQKSMYNVLF